MGPKATEIWNLFNNNLAVALERYGDVVLGFATTVGGAVAGLSFQLLAMDLSVIVMGMMLSPGPKLGDMVQKFGNRVFAPKGGEFVEMAAATVRNVSLGVLGVAALQAGLMGVVMMLFGIEAAGPLAVVILILGIIQVGPVILSVFYELVIAWMNAEVAEEIEADAEALEEARK